ncbi:MAG: hypothetical protein ACUVQG_02560 [Thermogutta sp.]
MEYSLHQELKRYYAGPHRSLEVVIDGFRVDAISHGWLIEIQHGPLVAIRKKIQKLVESYPLLLVKPVVGEKQIVRLARRGGPIISRRRSPKRGQAWEVFHDLIHFARIFPHPNLRIDVALVDIEEIRYPGPRQRWGYDGYRLADRRLIRLRETIALSTANDLRQLLPEIPEPFDSHDLATALGAPRWVAQRIAYSLRKSGAVQTICRDRRGHHYRWNNTSRQADDRLALLTA